MFCKWIKEDGRWAFSEINSDGSYTEISDEHHASLFADIEAALPVAKIIGVGTDGLPEVQDPQTNE